MRLSAPIYQLKRRAKLLARDENIALHEALDRIAQQEGFAGWSLLSSQVAMNPSSKAILSQLDHGDLLLLGARPGQGKTVLGLQLLCDAARAGRRAVFFSLEYTERGARAQLGALDADGQGVADKTEVVTSDDICADFITQYLAAAPRGTIAIIDYLQILDQQRNKPALAEQLLVLQAFARKTGVIFGFITQIDRAFDPDRQSVPDFGHIRLPNPIAAGIFTKACFLHDGAVRLHKGALA